MELSSMGGHTVAAATAPTSYKSPPPMWGRFRGDTSPFTQSSCASLAIGRGAEVRRDPRLQG